MFKNLRVKITPGQEQYLSRTFGIADSRADQIIELCKLAVDRATHKSEAIETIGRLLNTSNVNEYTFGVVVATEMVKDLVYAKEKDHPLKDVAEELGLTKKDFDEMEDEYPENMPEVMQKANEEIAEMLDSYPGGIEPKDAAPKAEAILKKYKINAKVVVGKDGIAISINKKQFEKTDIKSVDHALELLQQAKSEGNQEEVDRISKWLSDNSAGEA